MPDPFNMTKSTMAFWQLMAEAQWVMTIRMLGLAGVLPLSEVERRLMVSEKGPAFAQAWMAAAKAAGAGHSADRVALAAMRPVGRKTRANVRRLTKRPVIG